MKGSFELKTPKDLFAKLEFDFQILKEDSNNTYAAFNFFVTAEHMKDWIFPGKSNKANRENLENSSVLLQICSHVANGAKHFQVEGKHHISVSDTVKSGGYFPARYFSPSYWGKRYFSKGGLTIVLQGEAEKHLGSTIGAADLAEKILGFWKARPETK